MFKFEDLSSKISEKVLPEPRLKGKELRMKILTLHKK